jgi:hypothetical protein
MKNFLTEKSKNKIFSLRIFSELIFIKHTSLSEVIVYGYLVQDRGKFLFVINTFKYNFPKLKAWHEYLHRERDPEGEGLVYIRHPWESGMDNSPMWDQIMERLQLRPDQIPQYRRADIHFVAAGDPPQNAPDDRFAYLVKLFADRDYDEARIREDCPFLVQDVLFNALMCRADRDLAQIARVVGENPSSSEEHAAKTARTLNEKLWDEQHGIYLDFDLVSNRPLEVYVAPNFVPLYAGIPDKEQARRMVDTLENTGFGLSDESLTPVPSYDRYGFAFFPTRYWRGPVWTNINWFLMRGLELYTQKEQAERLRNTIVSLCKEQGFYEYFDPTSGRGHGSDFFSWTAALLLDVLMDETNESEEGRQTSHSAATEVKVGEEQTGGGLHPE